DGVVYINKIAYTYKGTMPSNTGITLKDGTTIISEYAFYNCTNLTSIIIPNSVASIGEYAFSGSGLTSINIPNSIVSINNNTFYGCNSLLSVIIPDGVKYIGEYAFDSCANLESISIPSSVEVIDGNAFMGCAKLASLYISDITAWLKIDFKGLYSHPTRDCAIYSLTSLYLNDELVTELTIPNEITSIPNFALCGISSLASVVIPNTVSKIGSDAFSMSGLTSITIPNSITSIESYTFDCCSKLVSVTIPNSVKNIGLSAFYGCTSLESISIYANTPPTVESSFTSENYNIDILVPASAVETYRSTQPWSNFTSIKALPLEILEIKNSISTFCSNSDLDFTSISGLKAYIASGYNKNTGKVMLSRVYDVPAGTGLLLIGETGNYEVPITTSASCYSNFLKGVTTATTITPTSDGYNNYILANGTNGIGFYPVGEEGTLAAGKAYLQLPSSVSSAKGFTLSFEDETTGISDNYEVEIMNSDAAVYDLQGRKVKNPTKGLYIVNGKKVVIK
ncbi:MAG: leucine-rich repeat domain-containing protein, partial [Prevotella sp.]|nr:leucine-rich repeat domain-containing protein [Prevotella sp.]